MNIHHRIACTARHRRRQALTWLRRAWVAHVRLLRHNRTYEAAMAAAAANMITQTRWDRLIATVITGLFDIYAAVRRATSRDDRLDFYGYDMS
jgi:hypothetical protein